MVVEFEKDSDNVSIKKRIHCHAIPTNAEIMGKHYDVPDWASGQSIEEDDGTNEDHLSSSAVPPDTGDLKQVLWLLTYNCSDQAWKLQNNTGKIVKLSINNINMLLIMLQLGNKQETPDAVNANSVKLVL